jgi:hypothetical protein
MPTNTGIDAQIGYVIESTWGTAATVTTFIPLVSETLKSEINPVESAGILATRQVMTTQQWYQGNKTVAGDIQHEMYDQSMGVLLRAAFGTVQTTTAGGTGVHTFWPTTPSVSFTTQVGRPTTYGSVIPFTYEGCKINSWELAAAAGEIPTWGMSITAEEERMGTALASVSYASNVKPWRFQDLSFSVHGTTTPVKNFTLAGENSLAERRFLGSTVISEQLRENLAAYTGELQLEWGTPASRGTLNYHAFLGGTEGTLLATMTSGTMYGTITANVRFDGSTPNVAGPGILEHPIPFKAVASGSLDQHALQVVILNNQTSV